MKVLRVEEVSYHILYVENDNSVSAYKKINGKWEKFNSDWTPLKDKSLALELEKLLQEKLENK